MNDHQAYRTPAVAVLHGPGTGTESGFGGLSELGVAAVAAARAPR